MNVKLVPIALCLWPLGILANIAPTPVVVSAAMRPGTTLMDLVYRVNDPDDATVKVRALAFIGGTRSFANVIKPVTFKEGTAASLGDAIATNANHALTWDVAADWSIDIGQVKFEILCRDNRGLLQFDWITIPAAGGQPALTISKDTPASDKQMDALFWQYASGDPGLSLANGVLTGTAASGVFNGVPLADGGTLQTCGPPYLFKQMNLDPADDGSIAYANTTARAGLQTVEGWHAANRPYAGTSIVIAWGTFWDGSVSIPGGLTGVTAISAAQGHSLALKSDGTVVGWGSNSFGQATSPPGLSGVKVIVAAPNGYSLALKNDGTVVAWGFDWYVASTVAAGLSGVTAISAGGSHNLALKSDGTVVAWGGNDVGQSTIPGGLSGVTAISAGGGHSLALKSNGTVVAWGDNTYGQKLIPAGLSGVTAISAGGSHNLALKGDGTVVAWGGTGTNNYGQCTIPAGLSGVTAISAGLSHSVALKNDGTVVAWGGTGTRNYGQATVPPRLTGVTAIAASAKYSLVMKVKAP